VPARRARAVRSHLISPEKLRLRHARRRPRSDIKSAVNYTRFPVKRRAELVAAKMSLLRAEEWSWPS
jgi:hypothetical protein